MTVPLLRRVYWDSCTFLGLINSEPGKDEECRAVWREAEAGVTVIHTSFFTFAEVFKPKCEGPAKPLSEAGDKLIEAWLQQPFIVAALVDERIGIAARRLMRTHPECKKPSDGIHLASALRLNLDEMHTFDRSDLLCLDGRINREDGTPLRICRPYALPAEAGSGASMPLPLFDRKRRELDDEES